MFIESSGCLIDWIHSFGFGEYEFRGSIVGFYETHTNQIMMYNVYCDPSASI